MPSGKTHIAAGVITSAITLVAAGADPRYMLVGGFAALLPDTDKKGSTLGVILPLWIIFRHHRGFTHSYAALAGITIAAGIYSQNFSLALAMFTGYLSHIWLDYCTKIGVALWWPDRRKRSLRTIFRRKKVKW